MTEVREVIIDGVRYLPARDLRPDSLDTVRRLLIESYMGKETPTDRWTDSIGRELWITISEDRPETSYPDLHPTVDRFIEMATEALQTKPD